MNTPAAILDLLRHGETRAGQCFLGSTDAQLTDKGRQQMQQAIRDHVYDLVITSPLQRCRVFAQHYADQHRLPLLIEQDLREIHFGAWEGKTSEQLWQNEQQALLEFWQDPLSHTPPGGEAMVNFVSRVDGCYRRLQQEYPAQNILLVAHAGVIKVMICSVLGMSPGDMQRLSIDHGGMSRITRWQMPQVCFINR